MFDPLADIDRALLLMRGLWAPHTSGRRPAGEDPGVDLSTVLVVHTVGSEPTAMSVADVAERLSVAPATASRLCDRAVAGGFLAKAPPRTDARRVALSLTPAGVELRRRAFDFRIDYLHRLLGGWDAADLEAFRRLLTRFAEAVDGDPPRHLRATSSDLRQETDR